MPIDDQLVIGDCTGGLHDFDISNPACPRRMLWTVHLDGCIESTPAVWHGMLWVGRARREVLRDRRPGLIVWRSGRGRPHHQLCRQALDRGHAIAVDQPEQRESRQVALLASRLGDRRQPHPLGRRGVVEAHDREVAGNVDAACAGRQQRTLGQPV